MIVSQIRFAYLLVVHDLLVSETTLVDGLAQFLIDRLLLAQHKAGEGRNGGNVYGGLHLARGSNELLLDRKPQIQDPRGGSCSLYIRR